jgi:hypothetical protein
MFFAPQKPKTTVFTLVAKITVFIVFLCQCPTKTLVFTQFFTMLQDVVSISEKDKKHSILRCFCFLSAAEDRQTIAQKRSKIDFQKHLLILASKT